MKEQSDESLSLVLLGGSSGSFTIFEEILKMLRNPVSHALVFIIHRRKDSRAVLPEIFRNKTDIAMKEPLHLEPVQPNHIYFGYPDYHLLIGPDGRFYYDGSEKDFFSRPSIDATFISAALSGIPVKAAMLFSGSSADGAFGMKLIAQKGFQTYVQDPAFADSPRMPAEAIRQYDKHHVLLEKGFYKMIREVLY